MILEHNKREISAHYFQCPLKLVISMPETILKSSKNYEKQVCGGGFTFENAYVETIWGRN